MTDLIVDGTTSSLLPSTPSTGRRPSSGPESPVGSGREQMEANRLAPFRPAILGVRWATTLVSVVLAAPQLTDSDLGLAAWVTVVFANTVLRTVRPLRDHGSVRSMIVLLAEIALHVLAVIATGYWASPLVLLLINAVIIAGFARGFGFAIRVGAASTLAVSVPELSQPGYGRDELAQSAQWSTLLLLGGVVAGYARRISGEASHRHNLALDRVARLSDANELLTKLHALAQTLPASLDLSDVLDSTVQRLKGLVFFDSALILTAEVTGGTWTIARHSGGESGGELESARLPEPARRAIALLRLVAVGPLSVEHSPFNPRATHGVYVPLSCRDRLIGLLALERCDQEPFTERDQRLLSGFVEPVALSIDNARWFRRLRTMGADEERNRIARDLHDRIGQSLAHLGFEIDRLIRHNDGAEPTGTELKDLRKDLRDVVVEVRDALSDLRTDVGDNRDFATTAREFASRLAQRSGLRIDLDCDVDERLPIMQEREMWRIAQEALVNVERHADATSAMLRWQCESSGTLLEVADNGRGLPAWTTDGGFGRADSFGLIGMRERADSIGASLELISKPGEGTKVRCFLAKR